MVSLNVNDQLYCVCLKARDVRTYGRHRMRALLRGLVLAWGARSGI